MDSNVDVGKGDIFIRVEVLVNRYSCRPELWPGCLR